MRSGAGHVASLTCRVAGGAKRVRLQRIVRPPLGEKTGVPGIFTEAGAELVGRAATNRGRNLMRTQLPRILGAFR